MEPFLFDLKVKRKPNISKGLAKKYGGTWKYDGVCMWYCDDNIRHVSRVSFGSEDEPSFLPPSYYMYGDPTRNGSYIIDVWDL